MHGNVKLGYFKVKTFGSLIVPTLAEFALSHALFHYSNLQFQIFLSSELKAYYHLPSVQHLGNQILTNLTILTHPVSPLQAGDLSTSFPQVIEGVDFPGRKCGESIGAQATQGERISTVCSRGTCNGMSRQATTRAIWPTLCLVKIALDRHRGKRRWGLTSENTLNSSNDLQDQCSARIKPCRPISTIQKWHSRRERGVHVPNICFKVCRCLGYTVYNNV